jgi:hypothetical protein
MFVMFMSRSVCARTDFPSVALSDTASVVQVCFTARVYSVI